MKIIKGFYKTGKVFVGNELLSSAPNQKLKNHSPDDFAWGYGGSGPAQLSLALLLYFTGDEKFSLRHYQDFKCDIIANLKNDSDFVLPESEIEKWIFNKRSGIYE